MSRSTLSEFKKKALKNPEVKKEGAMMNSVGEL